MRLCVLIRSAIENYHDVARRGLKRGRDQEGDAILGNAKCWQGCNLGRRCSMLSPSEVWKNIRDHSASVWMVEYHSLDFGHGVT
jgi:hypothetical protein